MLGLIIEGFFTLSHTVAAAAAVAAVFTVAALNSDFRPFFQSSAAAVGL